MNNAARVKLLFGPYRTPSFHYGDTVLCAIRGPVNIVGLSNGRIQWPKCPRDFVCVPCSFGGAFVSRYIAAAEMGGKVRLNRIDKGDLIARFDAPAEGHLADIHFSPDGRYLFGMNVERTKHHVWDLWKLRRHLAELKLDWETTPAPKAVAVGEPIVAEIAVQKLK